MWAYWTAKVAARLNRTVTETDRLSDPDFFAVLTDLFDAAERCPSCGLSDDAKWGVKAEQVRCPACEDRDLLAEKLPKRRAGWRVAFRAVDPEDREIGSSAALYTPGHRKRLHALRRLRR